MSPPAPHHAHGAACLSIHRTARWRTMLELGQVTPAAAYLSARRLRQGLLQLVRAFFRSHAISALAKPGQDPDHPGVDGLASLLGMPELTVPVGLQPAGLSGGGRGRGGGGGEPAGSGSSGGDASSGGGSGGGSGGRGRLPVVNTIVALPGDDPAVVAVGDAFQALTQHHLQRPDLRGLSERVGAGP
jgi:uncharacterized membrane protein YgcG